MTDDCHFTTVRYNVMRVLQFGGGNSSRLIGDAQRARKEMMGAFSIPKLAAAV